MSRFRDHFGWDLQAGPVKAAAGRPSVSWSGRWSESWREQRAETRLERRDLGRLEEDEGLGPPGAGKAALPGEKVK